jgi:hypothetical protein
MGKRDPLIDEFRPAVQTSNFSCAEPNVYELGAVLHEQIFFGKSHVLWPCILAIFDKFILTNACQN